MGKFGDLLVGRVSWFNYDLVMVLDFHIDSYVKVFGTLRCIDFHMIFYV
jgi:hypothetical protein